MNNRKTCPASSLIILFAVVVLVISVASCGSSGGGGGSTCVADASCCSGGGFSNDSGTTCYGDSACSTGCSSTCVADASCCGGTGYSNDGGTTCFHNSDCSNSCTGTSETALKFTNTTSSPVIIGFVNAAVGGSCPSADTLLTAKELSDAGWCSGYEAGVDSAGKCLVTLGAAGHATASVTVPNPSDKCMSGNFGAGGFASCSTTAYPQGWTQGEFTLNPIATPQEVVDISGVNGINYAVSISLGSGWYYGAGASATTVTEVGPNKALNGNVGTPGVYPNGCTDCIQLVGDPVCPELTTSPTCQADRICNVKRDSTPGGTVEFKIGDRLDT